MSKNKKRNKNKRKNNNSSNSSNSSNGSNGSFDNPDYVLGAGVGCSKTEEYEYLLVLSELDVESF